MLAPIVLVVTPLWLAVPALAAPKFLQRDEASCGANVVTQTVTAYMTVYAGSDPQSTLTYTEQYSPASSTLLPSGSPAALVVSQVSASRTGSGVQPDASAISDVNSTYSVDPPSVYQNTLYFTNWGIYGADTQPQSIPASSLTRVLYAFADIAADGEVKSSDTYADLEKHYSTDSWNDQGNNAYGCIKQLYILKKKNRQLKVLLSIGGWTYSPKFPPVAASDAARQKFASSAVKLVGDWGFDGIDIDWEYPANADQAQNFVLLLQACRQAFDNYAAQYAPGYHFLITIASPAGPTNYRGMDLKGMDPWVDMWNMMAYDYAGSWDSTSGHQANIYSNPSNPISTKFSTEQAVRDYIVAGIPSNKIGMGLPLYGRSFEATSGIGEPYNGVGAGTIQSGVWLYKNLPKAGATEVYDNVAKASYSYDSSSQELISYDNVASAVQKSQYLLSKGLGGAVFWEASGDATGAQSLVRTLATEMGKLDTSNNLLSYPSSQYDNIRNGMPGA